MKALLSHLHAICSEQEPGEPALGPVTDAYQCTVPPQLQAAIQAAGAFDLKRRHFPPAVLPGWSQKKESRQDRQRTLCL